MTLTFAPEVEKFAPLKFALVVALSVTLLVSRYVTSSEVTLLILASTAPAPTLNANVFKFCVPFIFAVTLLFVAANSTPFATSTVAVPDCLF